MKGSAMKLAALVLVLAVTVAGAQTAAPAAKAGAGVDALQSGFAAPPEGARPRVWWHWMNGNITKDGIKLDLEWMHRIGLAGYQNFDAALATPQVVKERLVYMTPEWKDAFLYATKLATDLKMEQAIAGSPGWSESGGPWVAPSEGMKKYVWSVTEVEGGKPFTGKLAAPPSNTGAFQNIGIHDSMGSYKNPPQFYADAAVVAYRRPANEAALHAKMTASGGAPDFAKLTDGDLEAAVKIPIPANDKDAWIEWEFETPTTIRAVSYVAKDPDMMQQIVNRMGAPERVLEASDDGMTFREVAKLASDDAPEHTMAFAPATAKYFRVVFKHTAAPPIPAWAQGIDPATFGGQVPPKATDYELTEFVLHTGARLSHWQEKAAFVTDNDLYDYPTPEADAASAIDKASVIDLTAKMQADGTLDWTPPAGDWVVLRFGYSLLGITNHPATAEATGLEVDKMNRADVRKYFETYLDSYAKTVGPELMGKHGIHYVVNDSWEAGSQNWTDDLLAQFKKLRGYDATPWLPVLTGRVVESAAASDRFLWDFRKTIADLIATEHYGELETVLHERGMAHYGESHEGGRAFVADGMEVKKMNEVPMSAMWTQTPGVNHVQYSYNADDRESASVAHIYGQNIAAAESMTAAAAPWAWSPATLKPTADQELLNGINRFVIHESAHQPLVGPHTAPGLTLGPFGQWFNRNETWAEQAKPWIDYLARSSYMLQQGHFGADLVYFYGEDSNLTAIYGSKSPEIPAGFGYDYINADALMHALKAENGVLTTPGGTTYRVLGLAPYSAHMSLPVLKAIHKLVSEGAVVAGSKPKDDPSLADDQAEFAKLSNELFGDGTGVHKVGKGQVYAGEPLENVFAALKIAPDFDATKPAGESHLEFVHRKLADGDLYFVDNRGDSAASVEATFRVAGKTPELWYAETGTSKAVSYTIAEGRTTVPLELEPWGTVFVVFRKAATAKQMALPKPVETELTTLQGPWTVTFPANLGAPASATLPELASWSENKDAGVKYFSGTGTYTKTVDVPAKWLKKGARVWLELGDVKNLAEVEVNGKPLGQVWHAPYRVDVSAALKAGSNAITIKVTNAWVNRMIGDEQPGVTEKITMADVKPYKANSPLLASGLLGPVKLVAEK